MFHRILTHTGTLATGLLYGQNDWPIYGHDPGKPLFAAKADPHRQYRSAPASVDVHTGKPGSEGIPIVVGGVMYLAAPTAVRNRTGNRGEIWRYEATQVALRGSVRMAR